MFDYPVVVHESPDGCWVICPDLPEMHSAGDTPEQALAEAVEGVATALEIYIDQRRAIPLASAPKPGQPVVRLPALITAKAALWNAMTAQGLRKADLARLLDCSQPQIDRLLQMGHSSKIERVEQALQALGKRLGVVVDDAA